MHATQEGRKEPCLNMPASENHSDYSEITVLKFKMRKSKEKNVIAGFISHSIIPCHYFNIWQLSSRGDQKLWAQPTTACFLLTKLTLYEQVPYWDPKLGEAQLLETVMKLRPKPFTSSQYWSGGFFLCLFFLCWRRKFSHSPVWPRI